MRHLSSSGRPSLALELALLWGLVASASAPGGTSNLPNPTVVFDSPGLKTVTLQECNSKGCSLKASQILVLDPRPVITSAATEGLVAEVGQQVHLLGAGFGKPPLNYTWRVLLGGSVMALLPGSETWWDTTGFPTGLYTIVLHLGNDVDGTDSPPLPLALNAEQALDFYTLPPCRVLDTRQGAAPLAGGTSRTFDPSAAGCGVPSSARAVAINVTAVNATSAGSVTVYPGNYPIASTSVLSFGVGSARAGFAVAMLSTAGAPTFAARASMTGAGTVDLIVDVTGYFAPSPVPVL